MNVELALRACEVLIGWAFLLQSLEHVFGLKADRTLHAAQGTFALLLIAGLAVPLPHLGLVGVIVFRLDRYDGPYNGGADRLGYLNLLCLTAARLAPTPYWRDMALAYLGLQMVLSYAISGWVKLVNPEWRAGRALCDVFAWSAYPQSEALRGWASKPRLMLLMSWGVIVFELAFPLALVSPAALALGLLLAASLHLANAWLFGLNRFVWVWVSGYPALWWLQGRLSGALG